jgi:hypothetical protein
VWLVTGEEQDAAAGIALPFIPLPFGSFKKILATALALAQNCSFGGYPVC